MLPCLVAPINTRRAADIAWAGQAAYPAPHPWNHPVPLMPTIPSTKPARPLSPHLQVYKPQLTSVMSILHRMSGVWLAMGLPVFVAWLVMLAANERIYGSFVGLFQNWIGQILLFGWTYAFFYHFCTGIRHLLWDAGFFLELKGIYTTGWIAFGVATLLTAYVWLKIFGVIP